MREKGSSPIGVGVLTVLTVLLVLILALSLTPCVHSYLLYKKGI